MDVVLPDGASAVMEQLHRAGFEAYAVGGCVRDSLLGRVPEDWDITTDATPDQVKQIFQKTVDTGIEHGTVTVLFHGVGYEVTTYRIDGDYSDGRHPDEVIYTDNLTEDLRRRDFTINAMAYNQSRGLVDVFGGKQDLRDGIVRCVGRAADRFQEDALRILRAVRFCAQLGFSIEQKTGDAAKELAHTLSRISAERIQAELIKLLISQHPEQIGTAWALGITQAVLPEIHEVSGLLKDGVRAVSNQKELRLAMLFWELPPNQVQIILRRLKFDNATCRIVFGLAKNRERDIEEHPYAVRRAVSEMGAELFELLLCTWEARAKALAGASGGDGGGLLAHVDALRAVYRTICERGDCLSLRALAVNGADLIAEGIAPGKELGEQLQWLLDFVLRHPERNSKQILLEALRRRRQADSI